MTPKQNKHPLNSSDDRFPVPGAIIKKQGTELGEFEDDDDASDDLVLKFRGIHWYRGVVSIGEVGAIAPMVLRKGVISLTGFEGNNVMHMI